MFEKENITRQFIADSADEGVITRSRANEILSDLGLEELLWQGTVALSVKFEGIMLEGGDDDARELADKVFSILKRSSILPEFLNVEVTVEEAYED